MFGSGNEKKSTMMGMKDCDVNNYHDIFGNNQGISTNFGLANTISGDLFSQYFNQVEVTNDEPS